MEEEINEIQERISKIASDIGKYKHSKNWQL